jgi:hypothetical protein
MFKYKHSIKNGIQSTGHKFRFGRGKFHHPLPETEILLYLQYENYHHSLNHRITSIEFLSLLPDYAGGVL